MRDTYKRFIECGVPGTACNLRCSYCYVGQKATFTNQDLIHRTMIKYRYAPAIVGKALAKERLGGCAYINVCGAGETLMSDKLPEYIKEMLMQGHYVNIYTNGTINKSFDALCRFPSELLERLSFAFSLHWLELIRTNLLQDFFNNFNKMKKVGCSTVCNMVLDDSYLPYAEEIKAECLKNIEAFPQISFPKKENKGRNYTELCKNRDSSEKIGDTFNSSYFDFTKKYFNYNKKSFCYAGAWSFTLNLETGDIAKCYRHARRQNIFKDVNSRIKYAAVGNHCLSNCCGGGLMLPQGLVPELNVCSYVAIKDRPEANWYTKRYKDFLSQQLFMNNDEYSLMRKRYINIIHAVDNFYHLLKNVPIYVARVIKRR